MLVVREPLLIMANSNVSQDRECAGLPLDLGAWMGAIVGRGEWSHHVSMAVFILLARNFKFQLVELCQVIASRCALAALYAVRCDGVIFFHAVGVISTGSYLPADL